MISPRHNVLRCCALWGVTLIAGGGAALLGGCKGNTQAAAINERLAGKPPVVAARHGTPLGVAGQADSLLSSAWGKAEWWPLVAPANTAHTTPASRAAALYDAGTLYVAVISELPEAGREAAQDVVSLYLDSSGKGKEVLQVTTDMRGVTRCAWIRSGVAVGPLEDGAPDLAYPLDIRPDFQVRGLAARVGQGLAEGRAVWTVVFTVPVAGLPVLMQSVPGPGARWKFNVLRTLTRGGGQYQANLSPVYVNAAAASAYRMAELKFVGE
jgi:hypothetical protein